MSSEIATSPSSHAEQLDRIERLLTDLYDQVKSVQYRIDALQKAKSSPPLDEAEEVDPDLEAYPTSPDQAQPASFSEMAPVPFPDLSAEQTNTSELAPVEPNALMKHFSGRPANLSEIVRIPKNKLIQQLKRK